MSLGSSQGSPSSCEAVELLPSLGHGHGGPFVQESSAGRGAAGRRGGGWRSSAQSDDLQLLALGDAERFLQGVDAVVDRPRRLEPIDHLLGRRGFAFRGRRWRPDRRPSRGRDCKQPVLDLQRSPLELVLLGVGGGHGADAGGDQRLAAVAVLHGRVPTLLGRPDVDLHQLGFEERLAGADPFFRIVAAALLLVGVPGAGIADGIDVVERLCPAAEVGRSRCPACRVNWFSRVS